MLLLVANYVWVLRADTAFEEASAEQAERWAHRPPGRVRPTVGKTARTPFALAPTGRVETAILWKNLIQVSRYLSLRLLWQLLPLVIVLGVVLTRRRDGGDGFIEMIAAVGTAFLAMIVMMGPHMARNDLRQDLAHLATIRTWPVRGAAIVRGEALTPTAVLSGFVLVILVVLVVVVGGLSGPLADRRWTYAGAALLLAPSIILTQVVIQNGFAVAFPAWTHIGPARARGFETFGQQIIVMLVSLFALAIALLPAALSAGGAAFIISLVVGRVPAIPVAAVAAVVLVAECWIATEAIGQILDRTDVTAIDAPMG
jgi:hypothetical protein